MSSTEQEKNKTPTNTQNTSNPIGLLESSLKPFDPRRWPFYYGWFMLPCAALCMLASMPGQTAGVGAFIEQLLIITGLSRMDLAIVYGLGTFGSSLILPKGGRAIDRYGIRVVMVITCASLFILSILFAFLPEIIQTFPISAQVIGTWSLLILLFLVLRFTCQGMMTLCARNVVGRWFRRYRGRASSVSGVVNSAVFSLAPFLFVLLMDATSYRSSWLLIGVCIGIGLGIFAAIFFRDRPEYCGLIIDGGTTNNTEEANADPNEEAWVSARDARRQISFWAISLILCGQGLLITAFSFHLEDFGQHYGYKRAEIFLIFFYYSFVSIGTGFILSMLLEKIHWRWSVAFMGFWQLISMFVLSEFHQPWAFWTAVATLGMSSGCFGPVSNVAVPNAFGREELGSINGLIMSFLTFSSALAPLWLALCLPIGGYPLGFLSMLPVTIIGLSALLLCQFRKSTQT